MSSSASPETQEQLIAGFISRWQQSGAGERANFQSFINELCDLLAVPRPNPTLPYDRDNAYGGTSALGMILSSGGTPDKLGGR